jgi:hypothetical protein
MKSGTGLPHSKTLARNPESVSVRQVLECGSPVPLFPDPGGVTDYSNGTRQKIED